MTSDTFLLQPSAPIVLVTAEDEHRRQDIAVAATRDRGLIRRWAEQRRAEPATGEQTPSGAATIDVNDHDAGIRFNFPALSRFRPIDWSEWFENFDRYDLMFVYERDGPQSGNRYRLVTMKALQDGGTLV